MLKSLLLSGWFRVQPFLKYVVFMIMIAPLVAASGQYTSAKQSEAVKIPYSTTEANSVIKEVVADGEFDWNQVFQVAQNDFLKGEFNFVPIEEIAAVSQQDVVELLKANKIEPQIETQVVTMALLAPESNSLSIEKLTNQRNLVERLKAARIQSVKEDATASMERPFEAAKIGPLRKESQSDVTEISVGEPPQEEQKDPIGSAYPIPWDWIMNTHQTISSKSGSGVRYYRSVPVISPDGKYAVYSRVKLEIKPELYNSRVSSILFVEDLQTRKLSVVASTATEKDPLFKVNGNSQSIDTQGTIGVLVPVSWSEKGDRFLARKFEGLFNTSDATDSAVIWDRDKNHVNTITPAYEQHQHEQIAVLLGWSKTQPDQALFRAGELGEEDWPLVKVASDGKTVTATNLDQPITFGQKVTDVWAGPQVAYR